MIFSHKLDFRVHHPHAECTIEININDTNMFTKTYEPGSYTELVEFDYDYADGVENILTLVFTSDWEAAEKYLLVNDITVNTTRLETVNCLYEPIIHDDWWQSLTHEQQQQYESVIYGNANSHYGWYGTVSYTYFTGINSASTYKAKNQFDRLFTRKTEWVLMDTETAEFPWR